MNTFVLGNKIFEVNNNTKTIKHKTLYGKYEDQESVNILLSNNYDFLNINYYIVSKNCIKLEMWDGSCNDNFFTIFIEKRNISFLELIDYIKNNKYNQLKRRMKNNYLENYKSLIDIFYSKELDKNMIMKYHNFCLKIIDNYEHYFDIDELEKLNKHNEENYGIETKLEPYWYKFVDL